MFDPPFPHVYTLPPGVDFAAELVRGLRERMAGQPPEAMAAIRLYVNSRRMQRRIVAEMTGAGAAFLPRIALVTDLAHDPVLAGLPAAASPLRRRLELSQLIRKLLDGEPDLAPRSALYDLSDSLANLMEEMHGEGVAPERIAGLDVSEHSAHWSRTQKFLEIIAPFFAAQGAADDGARQRLAAERLAALWATRPPAGPVIVAGSTGSRGATALLIEAVARLERGAVVLPGFDDDLPGAVWQSMDDALAAEDHPQYRFRRLMDRMGLTPADLRPWRRAEPADRARNRLISLSLRPAPITDQWLIEGQALPDLLQASQNMSLIEAASPRDEALAIALILRQAAETGRHAALVTPDRTLGRRVTAALDRWGIRPDDSAGLPLALSAPGRLLRHVADLPTRKLTADALLTLLKHPLTASGADRGNHLRLTRDLELRLRRHGPAFPDGAALLHWAATQPDTAATPWAEALAAILAMATGPYHLPLSGHVERHIRLAEALARGTAPEGSGGLWEREAGAEALALLRHLQAEAPFGGEMTAAEYRDLFEALVQRGEVRNPTTLHPRITIIGAREARESGADLVILGGLTDGTWPAIASPDPWLNRKMRKDAGLLLPERQIGLAAHDYQQAVAAPEVVLSRALRDAEAETVPSRWLNRLCNLMEGLPARQGPKALAEMRARGNRWLARAALLEQPTPAQLADPRLQPAKRPQPQPPIGARPARLSLTAITTLIRDPYAIYARHVLRLNPLDPLFAPPDPRDRGNVFHKILEDFVRQRPNAETQAEARLRLLGIARRLLASELPFPAARALWLARMDRAADHFLTQDRRHASASLLVENKGEVQVAPLDFRLNGRIDRIDRLPDGRLLLIDYKTGTPPSPAQQEKFDKQLLLAAGLVERGGIAELGPQEVGRISYVGLGSGEKVVDLDMTEEIINGTWEGLIALLSRYAQRQTGYTARRAVFETRFEGDYDHLARFGEWEMTDRAVPEKVGPP